MCGQILCAVFLNAHTRARLIAWQSRKPNSGPLFPLRVTPSGGGMDRLFSEIAMHQALGRAIDHLGQPRFWRFLVLLLNEMVPFDNALATAIGRDGVPLVLDEYDTGGTDSASPVPLYLNGLYLLDPFLQAAHDGL
ncbi:MAG: helix-turn-helix transcriptional regulator, partial [Burkholderia ambifaria]